MATDRRYRAHEAAHRYLCRFGKALTDTLVTECFYNREGLWYYAGSYQAFRLEDLTLKEWTELPAEVS
jgi:hypothetical protein